VTHAEVEAVLDLVHSGPLDPHEALSLGERLRAVHPAEVVASALTLHDLRLTAQAKFRLAARLRFTREGLEQATSEPVARHRAGRFDPVAPVVGLCCGIGGDVIALADGREALAVDKDCLHLDMALHNVPGYGAVAVRGEHADARDVALPSAVAVFVDPARRAGGRRLRAGDGGPPLAWCLGLAAAGRPVAIKTAPGLPLDLVQDGWEAEFVAVGRELKEAALWSPAFATAPRRATVLTDEGVETLAGTDAEPVPIGAPGTHLVDPNPAVTRSGLVAALAAQLGAWLIDDRAAILSAAGPVSTPFGRTLAVVDSLPWNLKALRASLRARDVGEVQIRKRGSAVDVDALSRQLRLDGPARATVVLTRVAGRSWAFVCDPP
jgi:hypothetical protein